MRTIAVEVPDYCYNAHGNTCSMVRSISDYCKHFEKHLTSKKYFGGKVLIPCQECKDAEIKRNQLESDSNIPKGCKQVEAYETSRQIVVLGIPTDEKGPDGESLHNCDVMGCSSVSHVKYRFNKC